MTRPWHAIMGFPRFTAAATFSSGATATGYPASHLGILPLSMVWRSADLSLANTQFSAAFAVSVPVELVVLCRHNLSPSALARVRIYSDPWQTTLVYDSGWLTVWPQLFEAGTVAWEEDRFFSLSYLAADLAGYPWYRPIWLSDTAGLAADPTGYLEWEDLEFWTALRGSRATPIVMASVVKVEIDDRTNPAGYVEMGLCEISQALQLVVNFSYGAQFGFTPRTLALEADGRAMYFRRRPKRRVFSGEVQAMPRQSVMSGAFELQRLHDIDVPYFWWESPRDGMNAPRTSYLARNAELPLFARVNHKRDRVPLANQEVL